MMRGVLSKCARGAAIAAGIILAAGTPWAANEFLGMDRNGDLVCDGNTEMTEVNGPGDVGVMRSVDIFWSSDDLSMFSVNCFFCVNDSDRVTLDLGTAISYSTPAAWTNTPIKLVNFSEGEISADLISTYPNLICWLLQSVDFTFGSPWTGPGVQATVTYEVASEGLLTFLLDGAASGWFSSGGLTGSFANCAATTSTEATSWSDVKTLFR